VIAGVLLLAALVALRLAMVPDDEPAPSAPAPHASAPGAPASVAESSPSGPAPSAAAPAPQVPSAAPSAAAPSAPELPAIATAFTPSEKHPPIANKALLREQVAAVQPQVVECAKQAKGSGYTANGTAVLTYMVAPHKDKQDVAIEQTGVEYDGTTIDNQPLLDCLKDTSNDMKFKFVPDTDGVFAFRRIKFESGKLVENVFVDFHYVR